MSLAELSDVELEERIGAAQAKRDNAGDPREHDAAEDEIEQLTAELNRRCDIVVREVHAIRDEPPSATFARLHERLTEARQERDAALSRAEKAEAEAAKARETERQRCIAVARGCMLDMSGGYSGEFLAAYQHGHQTVINALKAPADEYSTLVLQTIGEDMDAAEHLAAKGWRHVGDHPDNGWVDPLDGGACGIGAAWVIQRHRDKTAEALSPDPEEARDGQG